MEESSKEHINLLIGTREIGFYGSILTKNGQSYFRVEEPSAYTWDNGVACTREEVELIRTRLEEFMRGAGLNLEYA